MTGSPAALAYDPFDLATHCDPYPAYRRLRAEQPLYRNAERGFWALSRRADVSGAARDWRRFASARAGARSQQDLSFGVRSVDYVAADSERHEVVRRLLRRDFAAGAVARLEETIRAIAAELVDRLPGGGSADFVDLLAQPLPATVLCRLLGLAPDDAASVRRWNRELWRREPGTTGVSETVLEAEREARERIAAAAAAQSAAGVMRTLREAERARLISHDELLDVGVLLIAAGMKTTSALIGFALDLLARHPEQQRLLADDPGLIAAAVEEVLRFDSPAQWFARVTTTDVTTGHGTIPAGERVLLLFGSANRDERAYPEADRFDVRRPPSPHLSFGYGIHHCIAAALARLQARVCLEVVLARLRDLEPAGAPRRTYTPAERDLASLPLAYAAR